MDYSKTQETLELNTLPSSLIAQIKPGELLLGVFVGLDKMRKPLIALQCLPERLVVAQGSMVAPSTLPLDCEIAAMLTQDDERQLVILGAIHQPGACFLAEVIAATREGSMSNIGDEEVFSTAASDRVQRANTEAQVDGQRVLIEAQEEIVFRCGESSITLSKSGKIAIRGKYLLNRATGVNRILGGSVQVN